MAKQPNAPDAAPAAPNTSGADAVGKKTITAWKDWIVQFFQELLETRIDFWAPPQSSLAGDALLSVCCVALFYLARTTHADFSSAPGAPIATAAVAISAIILACIACAVDTESRKTFVQSV